jgi:hypothetical protein
MSVNINTDKLAEYLCRQFNIDETQLKDKIDVFMRVERSFSSPKKNIQKTTPKAPKKVVVQSNFSDDLISTKRVVRQLERSL